jgi:hypothetical protein
LSTQIAPVAKDNPQRHVFKRYAESRYFSEHQLRRTAEIHAVEDDVMNAQLLSLSLAFMSIFLAMAEQELSWKQWWDELPGDDAIVSFPNEYAKAHSRIVFL